MCDSFSPKKAVNRFMPELFSRFFEQNLVPLDVDWNAPKRRYNVDVFLAYLALDDKVKARIEPILYEIHTVASNIGTGEHIHRLLGQEGVALPEDMAGQTVHNQTLWVYLNAPHVWDRISRFAYADKVTPSLWFSTAIEPDPETPPFPDNENPDTDLLAHEIGERLKMRDGRGKYAQAEYFLRNGRDEYYFVFLDDYNKHKTECRGGHFIHDAVNYDSVEVVFVFHRDTRQLEARLLSGDRREKMEFCDIWAKCVKNCHAAGVDAAKPAYRVDRVFQPGFRFTADPDGKMVSARILRLCMSVLGCPGSKRVYEEKNGDINEKMEQEINQKVLPRKNRIVEYVVIQYQLADEFGRSKTQQLKVSRDGNDILDKNPAVQDILRESLVRWQIAAA